MIKLFRNFIHDTSGAAAIEYALIAAVIGVGFIAGAQALRGNVNAKLNETSAVIPTIQ